MTPSQLSTGALSAIIGMLSAIDRNHWPPSIGMAGRFHRNPHSATMANAIAPESDLNDAGPPGLLSIFCRRLVRSYSDHSPPQSKRQDDPA